MDFFSIFKIMPTTICSWATNTLLIIKYSRAKTNEEKRQKHMGFRSYTQTYIHVPFFYLIPSVGRWFCLRHFDENRKENDVMWPSTRHLPCSEMPGVHL